MTLSGGKISKIKFNGKQVMSFGMIRIFGKHWYCLVCVRAKALEMRLSLYIDGLDDFSSDFCVDFYFNSYFRQDIEFGWGKGEWEDIEI